MAKGCAFTRGPLRSQHLSLRGRRRGKTRGRGRNGKRERVGGREAGRFWLNAFMIYPFCWKRADYPNTYFQVKTHTADQNTLIMRKWNGVIHHTHEKQNAASAAATASWVWIVCNVEISKNILKPKQSAHTLGLPEASLFLVLNPRAGRIITSQAWPPWPCRCPALADRATGGSGLCAGLRGISFRGVKINVKLKQMMKNSYTKRKPVYSCLVIKSNSHMNL